jgi:hypothetical protein
MTKQASVFRFAYVPKYFANESFVQYRFVPYYYVTLNKKKII